jgi:hypothetical protein
MTKKIPREDGRPAVAEKGDRFSHLVMPAQAGIQPL